MSCFHGDLEFLERRQKTLEETAEKVTQWQEYGLSSSELNLMLRALHEIVASRILVGSFLVHSLFWQIAGIDEESAKVRRELEHLEAQSGLIKAAISPESEEIDLAGPHPTENAENRELRDLIEARNRAAGEARLALNRARIEKAQRVEQANATLVAALVGTLAAQFFAAPIVTTLTCAAIAAAVVYVGYQTLYVPCYGEVASSS